MLWAFEKTIFKFFASLSVTKLKPFVGKVKQSVQNYLNLNMVIGSLLESGFKATLSSKANVLRVWKYHFSVFCNYLRDKGETIFREIEAKQWGKNVQNLNQNLVIGSFVKSDFEANLSGKPNLLSVWKDHFSVFCKFLSDKV